VIETNSVGWQTGRLLNFLLRLADNAFLGKSQPCVGNSMFSSPVICWRKLEFFLIFHKEYMLELACLPGASNVANKIHSRDITNHTLAKHVSSKLITSLKYTPSWHDIC
jgi:hypothetical protein